MIKKTLIDVDYTTTRRMIDYSDGNDFASRVKQETNYKRKIKLVSIMKWEKTSEIQAESRQRRIYFLLRTYYLIYHLGTVWLIEIFTHDI